MGRPRLQRLQRVRVAGASMTPALLDGDLLLVRRGARIRSGDIVVAVFRSMPGRYVVKRAAYPVDEGWWLTSDNPFAPGDSTSHGVADAFARVILRVPRGGLRPRRVH